MSILNVNTIQPVGSGQTITVSAANITASSATITASSFVGSVSNTSGTTVVAAGSTAAPSISPSGDSNTGIFFPSADTIAFGEGGSEAARFDSSGRLGIGTVLPNTKLHIAEDGDTTLTIQSITGSGQSPSIRLQRGTYGTDGFNDLRIYNVTGALLVDNIDSAGAATNLLYANPTGVGIGSIIPENKLDVNGTIKSYSGTNKATFKDNQLRSDASGTFYFDHGTIGQSFTFRTSTSSSLDTTGPSITSAGNLAFPSGKGIDFSATANGSGSVSSEVLDDYEIGFWTPTLTFGGGSTGLTYSRQLGRYVKIGNYVQVVGHFQISTVGSSTGSAVVGGLPFSYGAITGGYFVPMGVRGGLSLSGLPSVSFYVSSGGGSTLPIYVCGTSGGGNATVGHTAFATNTEIDICVSYYI